jgi:hypothetical protein
MPDLLYPKFYREARAFRYGKTSAIGGYGL